MQRPAACLFDLDGLLLDTEPLQGQAWREAARHFGADLNDGQLRRLRGRRRLDCADEVRRLLPAGISAEELLAVREPIAARLLPHARAMPGAQELVQRCRELAIPTALATSSAAAAVNVKAAPHPWLELITLRVMGDDPDLRQGKPAPDIFRIALERLGVAAAATWAFEDSVAGSQAATSAGCRVYVLAPPDADRNAYPAGVVWLESLRDVKFP
ncbi:HAD family phosphatase [Cyanobium sp. NIES-981]|uniref:HAD family hydrolase n=1 Tax=Cyanobium sp. NIES-981 TaxID=1851505 RepID=UPI000B34C105|nr:HAD family phosphatase [Cyanobium sp. NIES-981]